MVDLHFDLPMDLYEKRNRGDVLATEFLPQVEVGKIGVIGAAIYIEDRYLPHNGLRVALDQIARLYAETAASEHVAICKSYREIQAATFQPVPRPGTRHWRTRCGCPLQSC